MRTRKSLAQQAAFTQRRSMPFQKTNNRREFVASTCGGHIRSTLHGVRVKTLYNHVQDRPIARLHAHPTWLMAVSNETRGCPSRESQRSCKRPGNLFRRIDRSPRRKVAPASENIRRKSPTTLHYLITLHTAPVLVTESFADS